MSKITLSPNVSGTGTLTIAAPNTNTDRTLTLPDATGTVQVSGNPISGTTGSFSGDLSFNSGYGSAAVAYGCRAWVNFNGTGTVAIRASGNVTSITDNGTGDYTVNFTTAMPDVNYILSGSAALTTTSATPRFVAPVGTNGVATGNCQIRVADDTGASSDCAMVSVAIHR